MSEEDKAVDSGWCRGRLWRWCRPGSTSHHGKLVRYLFLALLFLAAVILGSVRQVSGQSETITPLFSDPGVIPSGLLDEMDRGQTIRRRPVNVRQALLGIADGRGHQAGGPLLLNLFPGLELQAVPQEIISPSTGRLTWAGSVPGYPGSSALFALSGEAVAGTIRLDRRLFLISYAGNDVHLISELPPNEPMGEHLPIPIRLVGPDSHQFPAPSEGSGTAQDDGSIIDVLVVYTPAARNSRGGTPGIQAQIDLAIVETNQAYQNSQIQTALNLVSAAEVSYNESTDIITDLVRLRDKSDGAMDQVHSWRDDLQADMVSLIVDDANYADKYCGVAYLMTDLNPGFESFAFSVVNTFCATGYYSFGHELGHNMGSAHDRGSNPVDSLFAYSFGYQAPNQAFRTIMAYDCPNGCPRIQYFSNPDVTYLGQPTGVDYEANPAQAADNAHSINEARYTVANWRVSEVPLPDPPLAPVNLQATAVSFSEISLTWQNQADNADGITVERRANGGSWSQVAILPPSVNAYTDRGLTSEVEYGYRLRAYNQGGNSGYSNEASAQTEAAAYQKFFPILIAD